MFDGIYKNVADEFNIWLDEQLAKQKLDKVVGLNFNCYEDVNYHWAVELVGTSAFSEQNTDWACEELFATRENPFLIRNCGLFQETLKIVKKWIGDYLNHGTYKDKLKDKAGIGIGFIDGDLKIIYKNQNYHPAEIKKVPESDNENYYQIYSADDSNDLCLKINESELPFGRYEVYKAKCLPVERIYCMAEKMMVDSRDYLDNNLAFFIVSGKVKTIMTSHDIESCQFIDAVDKKTGDTIGYLVNCLKHNQALNYDKSVYYRDVQGNLMVIKPAILLNKIKHKDFFQIKEDKFAYFISDKMKLALVKANVKGFDFLKISTSDS